MDALEELYSCISTACWFIVMGAIIELLVDITL